ncbi:MAG: hypothetical protein ACRDF0_09270 [Candidatus Limnocylindria bacterium]
MVDQRRDGTEPALDIKLASREFVRIDGVTYDIVNLAGIGIRDRALLRRDSARLVELERIDEPNAEEQEEHKQRVRRIAAAALPTLPDDVLERMDLAQQVAVVGAFFEASAKSPELRALMRLRTESSASSSPTSPRHTAPANGSSTRPSRSSRSSRGGSRASARSARSSSPTRPGSGAAS